MTSYNCISGIINVFIKNCMQYDTRSQSASTEYRILANIVVISYGLIVHQLHEEHIFWNLLLTYFLKFAFHMIPLDFCHILRNKFGSLFCSSWSWFTIRPYVHSNFNYNFTSYSSRDIYHICLKVQSYSYITAIILTFVCMDVCGAGKRQRKSQNTSGAHPSV